jgi:hypothetical protein
MNSANVRNGAAFREQFLRVRSTQVAERMRFVLRRPVFESCVRYGGAGRLPTSRDAERRGVLSASAIGTCGRRGMLETTRMRSSMHILRTLAAMLALVFVTLPLNARQARHVRVGIECAPMSVNGKIRVMITMHVDSGWYTYWKNPGDSGLPPGIEWKLPEGYVVDKVQFPVPEKIVHEESIVFGYRSDFVLTTTIRVPESLRSTAFGTPYRVDMQWLVCKESCLKEDTSITFTLPPGDAVIKKSFDPRWDIAKSRMPLGFQNADVAIDSITVHRKISEEMATLAIHFALKDDALPTDFYPEWIENAVPELASIHVEGPDIVMRITLEDRQKGLGTIAGVLILRGKAYECTFPLTPLDE